MAPQVEYGDRAFGLGQDWLIAGRNPGTDGIKISDRQVSGVAIGFGRDDRRVTIANLSSRSPILVSGSHGPRRLDPDETLAVVSDCTVTVAGDEVHHLILVGVEAPVLKRPTAGTMGGTWQFVDHARPIASDRKRVLVAACLAHFEPFRFPKGRLTPREVVRELEAAGEQFDPKLTSDAVTNKLNRVRIQLNNDCAGDLAGTAELVEFVTLHGLVTDADIRQLRARQHIHAKTTESPE